MRHCWWAVGCLVLWQTVVLAQSPRPGQTAPAAPTGQPPQTQPIQIGTPQPAGKPVVAPAGPALDPQNNPLDRYLLQWEKEMMSVEALVASNISRTDVNLTFQKTDVYVGSAKYLKPNYAMLELGKKGSPDQFEKFVCSGQFLYQYLPDQKKIKALALPQPKPGAGVAEENNFLSFLFGMKAEEAKRRYELKLTKEDQYYVYIEVLPKLDQDKADFQRARLVLNKTTFMPRQLWFEEPNKDTHTWDIPAVETKVQLKKEEFLSPPTPPGWKIEEMPRNDLQSTQPRVIRGGGEKP
jgi:TIGR03009 family protein